jgi:hypothetical protein
MRTDREGVGKPPLVVAFVFAVGFKFARHRYHVGRLAHLFGHRFVLGLLLGDPARYILRAFHVVQQLPQHGPQAVPSPAQYLLLV